MTLWRDAARGVTESLKLLQSDYGVLTSKLLPYSTMLLTLAATWPEIADAVGPAIASRQDKLTRWFWCATFAQTLRKSTQFSLTADVPSLRAWLHGGEAPEVHRRNL